MIKLSVEIKNMLDYKPKRSDANSKNSKQEKNLINELSDVKKDLIKVTWIWETLFKLNIFEKDNQLNLLILVIPETSFGVSSTIDQHNLFCKNTDLLQVQNVLRFISFYDQKRHCPLSCF
jgi:hypothetical protein